MPRFAVILPAAGRSSRFKDKEKKPFVNLDGRAVWLRTAELFITRNDVVQTLLVIDKDDEEMVRRRYGANMAFMNVQLVHGGGERFESVANALKKLGPDADFVAIHDAVRPCVTEELIGAVFAKAAEVGPRCWRCRSPTRSSASMTTARCRGRCRARGCGWRKRRRCAAATGWRRPTPAAANSSRRSPTTPS